MSPGAPPPMMPNTMDYDPMEKNTPVAYQTMLLDDIGSDTIDILVGIPSFNEADSISYVVQQADKGLIEYFPKMKCKIINVDNNSPDNTKEAFLKTETKTEKVYLSTPPGVKGKGNNFYNLFRYAKEVGARSVVVVDADLISITPEWIEKLATPTLNGKAFVSPLYLRHKYDGTITNSLVFPLVFSLLNKYVRQPIGGDFSVRCDLIEYYLKQEWSDTIRHYGIDIFMTMNALLGGFPTEQVLLGAKIHKPSAPKLGPMFTQVIMTLFDMIIKNGGQVSGNRVKPGLIYNLPEIEPPDIDIDPETVRSQAFTGYHKNCEFIKSKVDEGLFERIDSAFSDCNVDINAELWAEIVFAFLEEYKYGPNRDELVEAFKCLYWGRVFSFIKRTIDMSSSEAEEVICHQAEIFWEKSSQRCTSVN